MENEIVERLDGEFDGDDDNEVDGKEDIFDSWLVVSIVAIALNNETEQNRTEYLFVLSI